MHKENIDIQILRNQIASSRERGEDGTLVPLEVFDGLLHSARERVLEPAHERTVEALGMYANLLANQQQRAAHLSLEMLESMIDMAMPGIIAPVETVHAA